MLVVICKNIFLVKICEKFIFFNLWIIGNIFINDLIYKKKLFFDNIVSLFKIKVVKVLFFCCN